MPRIIKKSSLSRNERRLQAKLARRGPLVKPLKLDGENEFLSNINDRARDAIFPILVKIDGQDRIVGTGFYITQDVFVTAKHVLEEYISGGRLMQAVGALHMNESDYTFRSMHRGAMTDDCDLFVGVFQPMHRTSDKSPLINKRIAITARVPEVHEDISTFAYPNHEFFQIEGQGALNLWSSAFPGKVIEHYDQRGPSAKLKPPYFQTDVHIHPSASGAPVFDRYGKVCGVCSCSYDGATDVSFVTPIRPILGLQVLDVMIEGNAGPRDFTVGQLAEMGFVRCEG